MNIRECVLFRLALYRKRTERASNFDTKNSRYYIAQQKKIRRLGIVASLALVALGIFAAFPISHKEDTVEATATPLPEGDPALNITSTSNIASVKISPKSSDGTFASSQNNEQIAFSVATSNLTGYNISISSDSDTGNLVNSDTGAILDTLASATDAATFATGVASAYNNKYGIRPSKINGMVNSDYLPAPTVSDSISIDTTTAPNDISTADTYTIGLGARLDYTTQTGIYTDTFILNIVANPISYSISYEDTSPAESEVEPTLPESEFGDSVTISDFTLSSTTPTRTGYTFTGWCDGVVSHVTSGDTTCDGTIYSAGADYDNFTSNTNRRGPGNNIKFYAMWSANTHNVTKKYRLQNADGSWGAYTTETVTTARYDSAISYERAQTNYKNSADGTNDAKASTSRTMPDSDVELALDLYRNTYTCTRQYRLQNADGSWGGYAPDGATAATRWGAACSYDKAVTNYKANGGANNSTATTSTTVQAGGGQTLSLDLYRNTFTCKISYKYQNADGSYGGATVAVNTTKRYGEACSWSTSSISGFNTAAYNANSYTNNSISSNIDTTVSITRKTFTCKISYKYQNADGSYGGATVAVNTTKRYGEACSWSTSSISGFNTAAYNANSYTNNSISSNIDTTVSITRKTFTCKIGYKTEDANGNLSGVTSAVNTTKRYGETCSWSYAANNTYQAASYSNSNTNVDTFVVLYRRKYTLTVAKGSNIASVSSGGSYRCGQGVSISATPTSTYRFSGWTSNNSGSFANNKAASTTFTMPCNGSNVTVTAAAVAVSFATAYSEAGKSKVTYSGTSYNTMQNMTTSICTAVTNGQADTLLDNRVATSSGSTKYTYTVAKLNGKCWMTHDLRYLNPSLSTSTSNVSSNKTLTFYDFTSEGKGSSSKCDADIYNISAESYQYTYLNGLKNACVKDNSKGAWYNYAAATAGNVMSTSKSAAATEDICPKNWKMPTKTEGTSSIFNGTNTYVSAFKATGSALGTYLDGGLTNATDLATWWTSNVYDNDPDQILRNFLTYDSSTGKLRTEGAWHGRDAGKHVRCIAK